MRPSARLRSWSRAPAVALHPCTRRGSLGSTHAARRSLSAAPTTAEPTLLISRDEERGIVTVAPNRPAKKNAIDRAMWAEVGTVLAELAEEGERGDKPSPARYAKAWFCGTGVCPVHDELGTFPLGRGASFGAKQQLRRGPLSVWVVWTMEL